MPTLKKRLNITLSPELEKSLMRIAKRDKVTTASKAVEMLRYALEMYEDLVFEKLAESRDISSIKFIPHSKVWN